MSKYWDNRIARAQETVSNKTQREIEEQLKKYYANAAIKTIEDFENVYNKILAQQIDGKEITPADLYKLDKYWAAQAQLRRNLEKLGDKQVALLTKYFELNFFD